MEWMKVTNNKASRISINENIRNLHHIYSTFLVKKNSLFSFGRFFQNGTINGGGGTVMYIVIERECRIMRTRTF